MITEFVGAVHFLEPDHPMVPEMTPYDAESGMGYAVSRDLRCGMNLLVEQMQEPERSALYDRLSGGRAGVYCTRYAHGEDEVHACKHYPYAGAESNFVVVWGGE